MQMFISCTVKLSVLFQAASRRDRHHRSDHPADIDGVGSVLNVHLRVFQGIVGVVQDFKTDVHHIVLELRGRVAERWRENMREEQRKARLLNRRSFFLNRFQITFASHRSVCVSVTPPPVCLCAIYLFVFLSVLPSSCDGTSPCLCGLVTF